MSHKHPNTGSGHEFGAHEHGQHTHSHDFNEHWRELSVDLLEFLKCEASFAAPLGLEVMKKTQQVLDNPPKQIADLGSGSGADTVALARHFDTAKIHAVDLSEKLLQEVTAAATAAGVAEQIVTHASDLNGDWPSALPGSLDVIWASLSLHHVDDHARVLNQIRRTLRSGGVLALTELRGGSSITPSDLGVGAAGLAERVAAATSHPPEFTGIDWQRLLADAGLESVVHFEHEIVVSSDTPAGAKFLQLRLRSARERIEPDLSRQELEKYDEAIAVFGQGAPTVTFRSNRGVWVARRG